MSELRAPSHCFYFLSILWNEDTCKTFPSFNRFKIRPISYKHPYFPMKDYYSYEMGDRLNREFVLFPILSDKSAFIEHKKWAQEYENLTKVENRRSINIDIGQLNLENMQLATGKPYAHRVYLGEGVYSELTYQTQDGYYQKFPWTYPDYQNSEILEFFEWSRGCLREMMHLDFPSIK